MGDDGSTGRTRTALRWLKRAIKDTYDGGASKRLALFAGCLGLTLIIALIFIFALLPGLAVDGEGLTANEQLQREGDARTAGLQALAGIVVAIGGAFTAYSVLSNREDKIDERFARALELMASEDVHVVSGGVYSLERIAVQSRFDRPAVIDALAGFIRVRAPLNAEDAGASQPLHDVMEALNVLGRVKELWGSPRPDLRQTHWRGNQLPFLNLSGALLAESDFGDANLYKASLAGTNFFRTNLSSALLADADLASAKAAQVDLSDATLGGASLFEADLSGADLSRAHINRDSNLSGANMAGAKLGGLEIVDADLSQTNLAEAHTHGAKYTSKARFPEGFDPAENGMVLNDRLETFYVEND